MSRLRLTPDLGSMLEFDDVGVRMPRRRRRQGGGRRQRLRRMAGEVKRDEVWHLEHATFRVDPGEAIAIVGRKGSGREVLLRLAAGTLIPDAGEVRRREPILPVIGVGPVLARKYTVRQNIYMVGGLLGMTPEQVSGRLDGIVELAGVGSILDKYLGNAPALLRQKLAWSISMATDARAFAVWQTLVVGDPEFRAACWERVREMKADGVTFLVASDVPRTLVGFCDRAVLLDDGHVLGEMPVPEAIERLRGLRQSTRKVVEDDDDDDFEDDSDSL